MGRTMRRFFTLCMAMAMLIAMSCTAFAEGFDGEYFEAEGRGAAGQSQSAARTCAIIDAQRNLIGLIRGSNIDSDTLIKDAMLVNDTIKRNISGVIRNYKITAEYVNNAGEYIVVMKVPAYGTANNSVASAVFTEPWTQQPMPSASTYSTTTTTTTTTQAQTQTLGTYTGLIVDCRGLKLQTAMAPVIRDEEHRALYMTSNFTREQVIRSGLVSYSKGTANLSRAGSNPLTVKAIDVDAYCNPVVSNVDAARVLTENERSHFLNNFAVVFMRD